RRPARARLRAQTSEVGGVSEPGGLRRPGRCRPARRPRGLLDTVRRAEGAGLRPAPRPGQFQEAAGGARGQVRAESQAKRLIAPSGDFTTNGERLALAELCTNKKLYRGSPGLYADAFGADPRLANDLKAGPRYSTACHASLAAAEQGEDAAKPDR